MYNAMLTPPNDTMVLALNCIVHVGAGQHCYPLAVPAGHAVSILNAVPAQDTTFELQAQNLCEQFERFCLQRAGGARDCHALTMFVDRADHIEPAVAFGRRLHAGIPTTVFTALSDARWHLTLNAYFLGRV